MGCHGFGGDVVVGAEELQLAGCGDVGHMQTGVMAACQAYCLVRRLPAGFLAAYGGVVFDVGVVAVEGFGACHVDIDDGRVFAVGHQGQTALGAGGEDGVEGAVAVYQHVAGRGTHKQLDAGYAVGVGMADERQVGGCGSGEETVVDMALVRRAFKLVVEGFEGGGLGHGVGHVHHRCHATPGSGSGLALDVGFLGESRLAHVDVLVYHAGHNETPRGVYLFRIEATGCTAVFVNFGYPVVVDDQTSEEAPAFVDDGTSINDCRHIEFIVYLLAPGWAIWLGVGAASTGWAGACSCAGTSFMPVIICWFSSALA